MDDKWKELDVSLFRENVGTRVMKVSGFSEKELDELNSMDYREMKEAVLDALSFRNNGTGAEWLCGYGVFTVWIMGGAVFVEIGNRCD